MSQPVDASCSWKAPDDAALCYLDFLGEDLFLPSTDNIDSGTLAAAYELESQNIPDAQLTRKRSRDALGDDPKDIKDDPSAIGDDADTGCSTEDKPSDKKHAKGQLSGAAKNKACREKQRRERINVSFVELAKLVEPGKEPKTDKSSILSDAIKVVQQLRVENNQLRQLNKFLEERVAQCERDKGQQLFQFASLQQAQPSATLIAGAANMLPPQCVTGVPCTQPAAHGTPSPVPQLGVAVAQPAIAATSSAGPSSAPQLTPAFGMMHKPAMLDQQLQQPYPYWLPPSMLDTAQDSLLRPPAA